MAVDSFHLGFEDESSVPPGKAPEGTMQLYKNAIAMVVCHKNTPEKQEIMDEIEREIDDKYRMELITMQQRIELLEVLLGHTVRYAYERGSLPSDRHSKPRKDA